MLLLCAKVTLDWCHMCIFGFLHAGEGLHLLRLSDDQSVPLASWWRTFQTRKTSVDLSNLPEAQQGLKGWLAEGAFSMRIRGLRRLWT
jgi:hypothetical protein